MESEVTALTYEETPLFYSNPEKDMELGCIGHLRGDFGHVGTEFWHTWWEHQTELNTPEFKADIAAAMTRLREDLLRDYSSMEAYCHQHSKARMKGAVDPQMYGFRLNTDHYRYYIRCSLHVDEYFYVYCYPKERERLPEKNGEGQAQTIPPKKRHGPER
ncbi:MAG: hypothetical protein K6T85_07365 [Gorillibacterium sp.]|nr:hypothetical protein [Gorillibacterium sp.]